MATPSKTLAILQEVASERVRQDERWGEQNHPDLPTDLDLTNDPRSTRAVYSAKADLYKRVNEARAKHGDLAWDAILLEEVYEALEHAGSNAGSSAEALREELVQVAAVAGAWVEALDRRLELARELQADGPDGYPFGYHLTLATDHLKRTGR